MQNVMWPDTDTTLHDSDTTAPFDMDGSKAETGDRRDEPAFAAVPPEPGDNLSLVTRYFRDANRFGLLGERAERRLSARLARCLAILARYRQLPEGTPLTLRDVTEDLDASAIGTSRARRAMYLAQHCRRILIQSNLRLSVHLARRHANRGIPLTDLIQEGNVGLIKAVERFDPGKGFRFSTYAYWWISEEVKRSLKRGRRIVRTPEHIVDEIRAMQAAIQQLQRQTGHPPSSQAVADHLGTSRERILELRTFAAPDVSTEAPLTDNADIRLGDALSAEDEHNQPEQSLVPRDQERLLNDILSNLNPRERDILSRRFGLGLPEPETLQVISDTLGISRERVRQIEKGALEKLRKQYADLAHMAGN